jgi:hypothetical protein
MTKKAWETYEDVASYLLDQLASEFGLQRVEGKQHITGHRSGTKWEIDAKGVKEDEKAFLIFECRRRTGSGITQEQVGALAYRILDTGAAGGVMVSPLGLQEGGRKIAEAENIISVHLNEHSTTTNYVLRFLNRIFLGVTEEIGVNEVVNVAVVENESDNSRNSTR